MMLQWKSRVYSWGSGVTLGWTAVLFNVFFSRQSCKKLPTWWVLYSIRGESCIMSVTGLVIHSPQTFRVFFRGPRSLISCSLFLILTLRWGRRTWSEHLALPCFPPCPQGRHRLMSPICCTCISVCHKLAWLLKGMLCLDLNSHDPAPPQSRFLACGSWSVDLPDQLHPGVGLDGELWMESRGRRSSQRQDGLSR